MNIQKEDIMEEFINIVSDNNLVQMSYYLKSYNIDLNYTDCLPLHIIIEDNYKELFNYLFENNLFDFSHNNFEMLKISADNFRYYFCNEIIKKYKITKKWISENIKLDNQPILFSLLNTKNF
jgi:hypothetical protein